MILNMYFKRIKSILEEKVETRNTFTQILCELMGVESPKKVNETALFGSNDESGCNKQIDAVII